jgi:putative transposase
VQGELGEVTIETPRDRDGSFEPKLIGKHQRRLPGFDEKILALNAKGIWSLETKKQLGNLDRS